MGFSLRLNLWYTGFFVLGAMILFALAYVLLWHELGLSDREVVRAKIEACRTAYIRTGLLGVESYIDSEIS